MNSPMRTDLTPARVVGLHDDLRPVVLLLEVEGRDVPVELTLTPRQVRSLRLLAALHEHDPHPDASQVLHVDLLLKALQAGGEWQPLIVVRPGPHPAFWLRLERGSQVREVDLGVLDAVVFLLANRVPVLVTDGHDPWSSTLDRLRSAGHRAPWTPPRAC